jgi:Single-strand binding protein family
MPDANGAEHATETNSEQQNKPIPVQIGMIKDAEFEVSVWKNDTGLLIHVTKQSLLIASLALPSVAFSGPSLSFSAPGTLPAQRASEYPPITIEGYVGRTPAYRDSKHPEHKGEKELYFPLSYRPDPANRDRVIWYDILVFGEQADQWNKEHLVPKGKAVRVSGIDRTHTKVVKTKQEGDKERTFYEIHATEVKIINARPKVIPDH